MFHYNMNPSCSVFGSVFHKFRIWGAFSLDGKLALFYVIYSMWPWHVALPMFRIFLDCSYIVQRPWPATDDQSFKISRQAQQHTCVQLMIPRSCAVLPNTQCVHRLTSTNSSLLHSFEILQQYKNSVDW